MVPSASAFSFGQISLRFVLANPKYTLLFIVEIKASFTLSQSLASGRKIKSVSMCVASQNALFVFVLATVFIGNRRLLRLAGSHPFSSFYPTQLRCSRDGMRIIPFNRFSFFCSISDKGRLQEAGKSLCSVTEWDLLPFSTIVFTHTKTKGSFFVSMHLQASWIIFVFPTQYTIQYTAFQLSMLTFIMLAK